MKLLTNKDQIDFRPAEVILQLDGPRRVICTSPLGGGIRENLTAVFNHCDRDPATGCCEMKGNTYYDHLAAVAEEAGLNPETTAGLSTGRGMDKLYIDSFQVEGIEVTLLVTGCIKNNARHAGERATLWEEKGVFTVLPENTDLLNGREEQGSEDNIPKAETIPESGTINILLHIQAELTPGALAGAVMVIGEVKCAAIHHLHMKSCYSDLPATGSGTDGIIVVAERESERCLTQVRTDTRFGEKIAAHVFRVLTETLQEN